MLLAKKMKQIIISSNQAIKARKTTILIHLNFYARLNIFKKNNQNNIISNVTKQKKLPQNEAASFTIKKNIYCFINFLVSNSTLLSETNFIK